MRCKFRFVGLLVLILSSALAANAEVMDKEPSVSWIWAWAVAGGLASLGAWLFRWWAGLLVSVFVLWVLSGVYLEIRDPHVGPAILAEAGPEYSRHFYSAVAVSVLLDGVGAYLGLKKRRQQR